MGNDIIEKILPSLPLIIASELAIWISAAVLSIALIKIFC